MSEKAKKYAPFIVGIVVLLIGLIYTGVVNGSRTSQLDGQRAMIAQLELDKKNAANDIDGQKDNAVSEATGLDFARLSDDDKAVRDIIESATTWDDAESYNKARQQLIEQHGVDANSGLLTRYMPLVEDFAGGPGGSMINQIDASGANMTYDSMTSYVIKIDGNVYSYFTVVKTTGSNSKGKTASGTSIFTYDVDSDGNVKNIDAYTIG